MSGVFRVKYKSQSQRIINPQNLNPRVQKCYDDVFFRTPFFLRPKFESKTRIYSNLTGYNCKNSATIFINHIFYKSKKSIAFLLKHEKRHTWQQIVILRRKAGKTGIKNILKEIQENPKMTPFAKRYYRTAIRVLGVISDDMPIAKFADQLIEAERKNPTSELNITSPPSFLETLKIVLTTNPFTYGRNLLEKDANRYATQKIS
jgi:hypothetical protein